MRFRILGPVGYEINGLFYDVAGMRQRILLAALLVSNGRPVSADQLYTELWGENPPDTVGNSLQAHICRLRGTLQKMTDMDVSPPRLVTRTSGYALEIAAGDLDMNVFRERVSRSRDIISERPTEAYALLGEALTLWRGSPLQDVPASPLCRSVAIQLDEEYVTALEDKLWLSMDCEDPLHAVGELKRMSAVYPWRERITEMLMLALYRCGRQVEAVGAYNNARSRLANELGMEPSVRLKSMFREILNQAPSLR